MKIGDDVREMGTIVCHVNLWHRSLFKAIV